MLADLGVRLGWFTSGAEPTQVETLSVGEQYDLRAFVSDTRGFEATGVITAYFNVAFDSTLVQPAGAIVLGEDFLPDAESNEVTASSLRAAGGFDQSGALPSNPSEERLLFAAPFSAAMAGELTVTPALSSTFDSFFFGSAQAISASQIDFITPTVTLVGAGFAITPDGPYEAIEGGADAVFNVALTQQPAAGETVTVSLALDAAGAAEANLVGDVTLEFDSVNWGTAQPVTVRAIDDDVDDGEVDFMVTATVASTVGDSDYNGAAFEPITVSSLDDDVAGVMLSTTALTIDEDGSGTFTVVLDSQPVLPVILSITSRDPSEVTIDGEGTLQFTADNWDVAQTVTVRGVVDDIAENQNETLIDIAITAGADAVYQALPSQTVAVTTNDDDTPGFTVTPLALTIDEGSSDSFGVVLTAAPLSPVVLDLGVDDDTEVGLGATALTFTVDNWDTVQTVSVEALADGVVDGLGGAVVTVSVRDAESNDLFDPLADQSVAVTTADLDVPGFTLTPVGVQSVSEDGTTTTATVDVSLTVQPTSDVVLQVNRTAGDSATAEPAELTFTTTDWNTPQPITIAGVPDDIVNGERSTTFTVSVDDAASNDAFDAVANQTFRVTTLDDDVATVSITATDDGLEEGEVEGVLTVSLSAEAAEAVTVTYEVSGAADAADYTGVLSGEVVIPAGSLSAPINVPVFDDSLVEPLEDLVITLTGVSGVEGVTLGDGQQASITITDNEPVVVFIDQTTNGAEGGAAAEFLISQSVATTEATTVTFQLSGDASDATDYTAPATLEAVIPAGETSVTVTLPITQDTLAEGAESIFVELVEVTAGEDRVAIDPDRRTGSLSIADDDTAFVTIVGTTNANEAGEVDGVFTISQSVLSTTDTLVAYTISGSAGQGTDYTTLSGTATIQADSLSTTVTIPVIDDNLVEPLEMVTLTLGAPTSDNGTAQLGATTSATIDVLSDDLATVGIGQVVNGAESPLAAGSFRLTLDKPSATATTVAYDVTGSATSGVDYTALPGTVVIPAGQLVSEPIVVTVIDDSDAEGAESVIVTLDQVTSGLSGVTVNATSPASATILIDDDEAPSVSVTAVRNGVEAAEAAGIVSGRFRFSQNLVADEATVITYTLGGAADEGEDYTSIATKTVTIPAGQQEAFVEIAVEDDLIAEGNESVVLTITGVSGDRLLEGVPTINTASLDIEDNDTALVSIEATSDANEDGTQTGRFTIRQSLVSTTATQVTLALDGTAAEGIDFAAIDRSVVIDAGETELTIEITLASESIVEPTESIVIDVLTAVSLNGQTAVDPSNNSASIDVFDDDESLVSVTRINADNPTEGEGITFRFELSAPAAAPTTVNFAFGGDAVAGQDYLNQLTQLVFGIGQQSAAITLATRDDDLVEGSETLSVTLGEIIGLPRITADPNASVAEVTILDNETPLVSILDTSTNGREDGLVGVTFVLGRNLSDQPIDVTFSIGGDATPDVDYVRLASQTVSFPATAEFATVTLLVRDDFIDEGDESLSLRIESISGDDRLAIDNANRERVLFIEDNDTAGVAITPVSGSVVTESGDGAEFDVVLTSQPIEEVTVTVGVSDTNEGEVSTPTLVFTPDNWDTAQRVAVAGVADGVVDGDAVFNVTSSAASNDPAYAGVTSAPVPVTNEDIDGATLSISSPTVVEGTGAGTTQVTFTLTLDGAVEGGFTASYATAEGTATSEDFTAVESQVAFVGTDGESHDVTVTITRDETVEADEAFTLAVTELLGLSATELGGVVIGDPGTATIENDDTANLSITSASATESDGQIVFLATLDRPVQGVFQIGASIGGETATAEIDYESIFGSFTFFGVAGEERSLAITVVDDLLIEGDETLSVVLESATIRLLSGDFDASDITVQQAAAVGTIEDNDFGNIRFVLEESSVDEEAGTHTVQIVLATSPDATLLEDVTLRVTDLGTGTADDADYTFVTQEITFAAGSTAGAVQTVTLSVVDDDAIEISETVNLQLELLDDGIDGDVVLLIEPTVHTVNLTDDPLTGVITGSSYVDSNNDGVRQANEAAIAGTVVTLTGTDSQGEAVSAEVTVGADGVYRFEGLAAGEYRVSATHDDRYIDGQERLGTVDGVEGGVAGEDEFTEITLAPAGVAEGFDFSEWSLGAASFNARTFVASTFRGAIGPTAATPAAFTAPPTTAPAVETADAAFAAVAEAQEATIPAAIALVTAPPAAPEAAVEPAMADLDLVYAMYALSQQDDDEDDEPRAF